jgi:predicted transcriptional regulator
MYTKVDWMKAADQSILTVLSPPKPLELTPSNIARNAGFSRGYTSGRLKELCERGLVTVDESGGSHPYYSITERGIDVLNAQIPPEDLSEESGGD